MEVNSKIFSLICNISFSISPHRSRALRRAGAVGSGVIRCEGSFSDSFEQRRHRTPVYDERHGILTKARSMLHQRLGVSVSELAGVLESCR